jgi:hypothetical protein
MWLLAKILSGDCDVVLHVQQDRVFHQEGGTTTTIIIIIIIIIELLFFLYF